jgi:outer membrane protein OmpA-like peptidoglycan-associated protein
MNHRRALPILTLAFGIVFFCSCATKKYVQQQVTTTQAELTKKIDEEANRRADLGNQVQELTSLNKRNTARIEEVNTNIGGAVKSLEPKIEDASKTGTEARDTANSALGMSKENSSTIANRNNYQVMDTQTVLFKFGSADLDDAGKQTLEAVAKTLSGDRNLLVELQGYADSVGDPKANVAISNRRVDSVLRYLVGTSKVDLFRISSLGLGQANPVEDNKTKAGRAKNRRVAIRILAVKAQ